MGTVADLVAALHGLTDKKGTPAEKIKEFNLLLNSRNQEFSENVSEILDAYQPATTLGKLLRLKLIDKYEVSSEVWTLLQRDDTFQIKRTLKFDWFFKDVDHTMVQNVIPNLALSTRLKIINRYGIFLKNCTTGEALYKELKSRYGIKSAIPLLPACGAEFVKKELFNLTVLPPSSVMLLLLAKYQPIATQYVEFLISDESSRKVHNLGPYKCVFEQLSRLDPDAFMNFFLKYRLRFPNIKFGRRPLKKAIGNHFDKIASSRCDDELDHVLYYRKFIRHLSLDQIKKFCVCILPSTSRDFFERTWCWTEFITSIDSSIRSDVLISAFRAKYNKDCSSGDLVHKFDLYSVEYLPQEARIAWVKLKVPEMDSVQDEAEAIAHLPVETSMPRLKEIITAQSDATVRANVAKQMVRTLNLNRCYSGIKDLVDYFVTRFRNETETFRQTVVSELGCLEDLLLKMDWEDWSAIHDFIDLVNLNDEVPICQGGLRSIYSQQIHACFLKGFDFDPLMRRYVEFEQRATKSQVASTVVKMGEGTPYHRQCLEWYLKEFPTLGVQTEEDDGFYHIIALLNTLAEYNEKHKRLKIEIPEWLEMEIDRIVSFDSILEFNVSEIFKILTKNNFELRDRLQLKYFPKFKSHGVLCRVLKGHPDVILAHLDSLMDEILAVEEYQKWKYNSFTKRCKLYGDIREKMVTICLASLNQPIKTDEYGLDDQIRIKTNAVNVLAELMEPSKYLEFCLNHAPVEDEISEEQKLDRAVQRAICKSFKRITTPLSTLPVLRKFYSRSYLRLFCGSTEGVCFRIPENIIIPILDEWVDCPVGVRKRILSIVNRIAPVEYSVMTLEKVFESEKNRSLRLVSFRVIRDRFFTEPTDKSYDTFISNLQRLTEDDGEIIKKLLDINDIHDEYVSRYVELIWQLIDTKWANAMKQGKSKIIEKVDEKVIKLLSNNVCDLLLAHEMSSKLPKQSLSKYVYFYLLYNGSDEVRNHRLNTFMAALEPHVGALWNECERSSSGHVFVVRHLFSNIIDSLCSESLNTGNCAMAASVLSSLKKSMLERVELSDTMMECVKLDVFSLYLNLESSGEESTYTSALAELFNNYIEQYESDFGYSLMRTFRFIGLPKMTSKTEVAHELLKNHTNPSCHILATKMLGDEMSELIDASLYKSSIEVLSSSSHPHVQVAAADYFRSLSVTDVKL